MAFTFREAKRENVPLLLGIAGGTGAGKTWSAMTLAKGLSGSKRFAVIDTENGRAKHYADDFSFDTTDLAAPFRPERYSEAIKDADSAGYGVIVVDSMSHEWAGDGGLLDWQEEEFQRLGGRDAIRMTSWIAPKMAHRKFVTRLLQVNAHVILCFRAAERVDMVKDDKGKMQVVPKKSLTGLDGWMPITERNLPFELTLSLLMTADAPGAPKPIKLPGKFESYFPLDRQITAAAGTALGAWASGTSEGTDGKAGASAEAPTGDGAPAGSPALISDDQRRSLNEIREQHGVSTERAREIVLEVTGQAQVPAELYDAVLAAIQAEPQGEPSGSFADRAREAGVM